MTRGEWVTGVNGRTLFTSWWSWWFVVVCAVVGIAHWVAVWARTGDPFTTAGDAAVWALVLMLLSDLRQFHRSAWKVREAAEKMDATLRQLADELGKRRSQ